MWPTTMYLRMYCDIQTQKKNKSSNLKRITSSQLLNILLLCTKVMSTILITTCMWVLNLPSVREKSIVIYNSNFKTVLPIVLTELGDWDNKRKQGSKQKKMRDNMFCRFKRKVWSCMFYVVATEMGTTLTLLSNIKEWTTDTCNNLDESQRNCAD